MLNNSKGERPLAAAMPSDDAAALKHRPVRCQEFTGPSAVRALPIPPRPVAAPAVLAGEPVLLKKAVCMHEEDAGLLWKHSEYRTGYAEVRRWVFTGCSIALAVLHAWWFRLRSPACPSALLSPACWHQICYVPAHSSAPQLRSRRLVLSFICTGRLGAGKCWMLGGRVFGPWLRCTAFP